MSEGQLSQLVMQKKKKTMIQEEWAAVETVQIKERSWATNTGHKQSFRNVGINNTLSKLCKKRVPSRHGKEKGQIYFSEK